MSSLNLSHNTPTEPFGPANADDIGFNDTRVYGSLFETNNWMKDRFRGKPNIIVGRRGSGKTHYLHNVVFDQQYDYYVEIRTSRVLRNVARIIQGISEDLIFPETIAEVWETVLWTAVFSEVRKHRFLLVDELALIEIHLSNVGVRENDDVDKALLAVVNVLSNEMNRKHAATISEPDKSFDIIAFENAKKVVVNKLESSKKKLVIFIDSIKEFPFDIDSGKRALQGLLMFVGSMNKVHDVVDIRFCLPSELYQKFIELSLNPTKDFRRVLILQWDERDLVQIGAHRLISYLASYHPEFYKELTSLDLTTYEDSLAIFDTVFPKHINNQFGYKEETVVYILRHTQLSPRHFLVFLDAIFENFRNNKNTTSFPVSEEQIVKGIQRMEGLIVREIFSAFKLIYPAVEEICRRCLPKLQYIFPLGNLRNVFEDHGKTMFDSNDSEDFQRMLEEIGVIGRVFLGAEKDIYIMGTFKYTPSDQLSLRSRNEEDLYCVHPLFSNFFQKGGKQEKPVYPYGNIDDIEESIINNDGQKDSDTQKNRIYSFPPQNQKSESVKKIFVSYRRDDSADVAGRIYDRLVQTFGRESVFKDVDSIPPGLDFRDVIDEAVRKCDVFLVIIGTQWLELKDADGRRRIDDPRDYMRAEIEIALNRNIPVIPVLVQGASMPSADKLPLGIRQLAYRNGLQVHPDPYFHKDMDRLISKL